MGKEKIGVPGPAFWNIAALCMKLSSCNSHEGVSLRDNSFQL